MHCATFVSIQNLGYPNSSLFSRGLLNHSLDAVDGKTLWVHFTPYEKCMSWAIFLLLWSLLKSLSQLLPAMPEKKCPHLVCTEYHKYQYFWAQQFFLLVLSQGNVSLSSFIVGRCNRFVIVAPCYKRIKYNLGPYHNILLQ